MTAPPGTRFFWQAGGFVALALGIVGIPLPLLPTTPFMILAAFCFARSSPRLEQWLVTHRVFGPAIANWRAHGAISKRAKIYAASVMAVTPVATYFMDVPPWALIAQIVCLMGAAAFVLTRPNG